MANLKYKHYTEPTKPPCLMKNEFGEIFFVTKGIDKDQYFVTRVSEKTEEVETWQSDLHDYKPLPEGASFEFTN